MRWVWAFLILVAIEIVRDELCWQLRRKFPRFMGAFGRAVDKTTSLLGKLLLLGVGLLFLFVIYKLLSR